MRINKKFLKTQLAILWIIIGVVGRLLPHPPNMTPITSLCLFAGAKLSKALAMIIMLAAMLISDIALAHYFGYPAFGSWSLFTYSGFLVIILFGSKLAKKPGVLRLIGFTLTSAIFFWLWTNFGTWLLGGLYPKTLNGIVSCYIAGLPFLRNALLGDLLWVTVFFGSFALLQKTSFLNSNLNLNINNISTDKQH